MLTNVLIRISFLEREVNMLKNLVNDEDDSQSTNNALKSQEKDIKDLKKNLNDSFFSNFNPCMIPEFNNRYIPQSIKKIPNLLFSNEKNYDGSVSGRKNLTSNFSNEANKYDNFYGNNRRCMTDAKYNIIPKTNYLSQFGIDMDLDNMYFSGELELVKENEDLKKNLIEIKRNFIESVQNKDQQIKRINYDLNVTIENCEKLILETEENYKKFKKQVIINIIKY